MPAILICDLPGSDQQYFSSCQQLTAVFRQTRPSSVITKEQYPVIYFTTAILPQSSAGNHSNREKSCEITAVITGMETALTGTPW